MSVLKLIRGARVYAPQDLGVQDVLFGDQRVLAIAPEINLSAEWVEHVQAEGMLLLPGLVDSLVHIGGGGGEGGFHTRTPQMTLTDATLGGVTTVIGALGTDAVTRTLPDLLAKAHALEAEGITAFCYTGSYQIPVRTLMGNVTDDITLIDKFIGVGEVAIADHRSSQPNAAELARIAADARVAGMLAGKAGIVSIHVGDHPDKLDLLHQVVAESAIPATQYYPTHMNRNSDLMQAGLAWAKLGGYLDVTTSTNAQFIAEGEIPAAQALAYYLQQGVPVSQLTMSSDGNASLPVFDHHGQLVGLEVGRVTSLYEAFCEAVQKHDVSIVDALHSVTLSPATILKLPHKGRIAVGADADLVLVEASSLRISKVFAKGREMVSDGQPVVKGTFAT